MDLVEYGFIHRILLSKYAIREIEFNHSIDMDSFTTFNLAESNFVSCAELNLLILFCIIGIIRLYI